jgi:hypothetical protein
MDDEEVRAFVEGFRGADFDAIGVFAIDAVFGDHVRHCFASSR